MTADLSCDIYHHTDGQCCDKFEPCWHNAPIRIIPLEPKRVDDDLVTQMPLRTLFALAIVSGLIGLGTAIWMDHHYKNRDQIDQELTWRVKP